MKNTRNLLITPGLSAAERTFFESMDTFVPPYRNDGPGNYIRNMDPYTFEEWVARILPMILIQASPLLQ
jgi:hypothetical protein